jgi:hypothetical protein
MHISGFLPLLAFALPFREALAYPGAGHSSDKPKEAGCCSTPLVRKEW